jgi:hypothetical protein
MAKTKAKNWVLPMLAVIGVVFATFGYFYHNSRQLHPVVRQCKQQLDYSMCLKARMWSFSINHPAQTGVMLSSVYSQARQVRPIDLRDMSETAHEIGMALAQKNSYSLKTAVKYCGLSFKGACLHGFIMEELEKPSVEALYSTNLINYCGNLRAKDTADNIEYLNCLHGVGHELWVKNSLPLGATLSLCNPLPDLATKSACMSGELMEYSKDSPRIGLHSHNKAGIKELPCSDLSDKTQLSVCYATAGSYGQYESSTQPLQITMQYCLGAPNAYKNVCLNEVFSQLLFGTGGDKTAAFRLCSPLPAEYATVCRVSHWWS